MIHNKFLAASNLRSKNYNLIIKNYYTLMFLTNYSSLEPSALLEQFILKL